MNKFRFTFTGLAILVFTLMVASGVQAQATRTWVSGVGDDVNPCSRTAPCKTFAGAISKTAAGGEIDALDPGGFGTLTITKSILVDGTNGQGFASTNNAGGISGFTINDSATGSPNTIVVRLRNLAINGASLTILGTNGINFVSGGTLQVENVRILNQSADGIRKSSNTAGRLILSDVTISECGSDGIELAGTNVGNDAVTMDRVNITKCNTGVRVTNRATVAISNSVISNHIGVPGIGVVTAGPSGGGLVDLENVQINMNLIGVQSNAGNVIRLSNVHMTGNGNALNFNSGAIATYNNNRIFGNTAGENFAALADVLQQ